MAVNPPEPKTSGDAPITFGRSKRVAFTLNVGVMVAVSLAIVIGVNWLSAQPQLWKRFDVSSARVYTLGERTVQVLENLEQDVEAYVYTDLTIPMAAQRPSLYARSTDHVRSVLGEYEKLSDGKLEVLDWNELEPTRQFQVASEIGGGFERPNVVLFRCGEQMKTVDIPAVAITEEEGERRDGRVREPRIIGWRSEDLFTSAIVEITETESQIYFTVGHGEASIRPQPSLYAIPDWAASLRQDGYRVTELSLSETGSVPPDADAVIVACPSTRLSETEALALRGYLESGGRLVWLDSSLVEGGGLAPTPSPELFGPLGIEVSNRIVVQQPPPGAARGTGAEAYVSFWNVDLSPHPITSPLLRYGMGAAIYRARPIEVEASSPLTVTPLVRSNASSWLRPSEMDLIEEEIEFDQVTDVARSYDVGIAVELPGAADRPGRLVLFTGSLPLQAFNTRSANKTLFLNAVNWLTEREHLIGIDPKEYEERAIMLDYDRIETLQNVALIFVPGGLVLLGLFVWWIRRS